MVEVPPPPPPPAPQAARTGVTTSAAIAAASALRRVMCASPTSGGRRGGRGRAEQLAAASVDADGHVAVDRHPEEPARVLAVVVDRAVLGGAVVPDRDVAGRPPPAH